MVDSITKTLEDRLAKSRAKKTSLIARVIVINHLILGVLWFMLCLWIGDLEALKAIEKEIFKFLWAGQLLFARHHVDFLTITLPKDRGGLGLLLLFDQVRALLGKLIVWTLAKRPHALKTILQSHIRALPSSMGPLRFYMGILLLPNSPPPCLTYTHEHMQGLHLGSPSLC